MKGGAHYHLEGLVEVCGAWLEDYFDLAGGWVAVPKELPALMDVEGSTCHKDWHAMTRGGWVFLPQPD